MDLKYGVVKLRAMEPEDAPFLVSLLNRSDIEQLVVGRSFSVSKYNEEDWIKNYNNTEKCLRWIIELNGTLFGTIILNNIDWIDRSAEIGIKVNITEPSRISGDAKDAYYAVIKYAFTELNLHRITATVLEYNKPSKNIHNIFNFKQEGCLRKAVFKNNEYHNLMVFGLLKEDFKQYDDGAAPWQLKREGY